MRFTFSIAFALICTAGRAEILPPIEFDERDGQLAVRFHNRPVATYVYRDERIPRPYFAHVFAPNATQVTRNHPPIEGQDATDHATFHPGIWMAFGDLSGSDNWRLKARVVHDGFVTEPAGEPGRGSFSVRNRYLSNDGSKTICTEVCRYDFYADGRTTLLLWDSEFTAGDEGMYFGDQEEMGLGVRLTTPITVRNGGRIENAEGLLNESQVWGKQSDWCSYSGEVAGQRIGIALFPDPQNFRRCWYHARDYGFVAANPFGLNAFTRGSKSKVVIDAGKSIRLRFGVLIYSHDIDTPIDIPAAYADYLSRKSPAHLGARE